MNHTVRLINANAIDGIQEVIGANQWVDCIITNFNMDYFYEDTLDETFNNVVCNMKAVLACDGSIYIGVKVSDIPFVSNVFKKCGFILKNILTIPLNNSKTPCRPTKYIDEDLKYFLFFVHADSHPRYFNPVEHESMYCNCKFSANWDWFKGSTIIDAYRMMMEISTDHSQVVLDPFMDAGDVGEAAILQDRDFIGIEISRARFDDTKARLDDLGE